MTLEVADPGNKNSEHAIPAYYFQGSPLPRLGLRIRVVVRVRVGGGIRVRVRVVVRPWEWWIRTYVHVTRRLWFAASHADV